MRFVVALAWLLAIEGAIAGVAEDNVQRAALPMPVRSTAADCRQWAQPVFVGAQRDASPGWAHALVAMATYDAAAMSNTPRSRDGPVAVRRASRRDVLERALHARAAGDSALIARSRDGRGRGSCRVVVALPDRMRCNAESRAVARRALLPRQAAWRFFRPSARLSGRLA
ncbi:hypothetical protein [Burkholderia mayonis]|uniref:hypothetical protein n=1 Tax=Burkholderia mayonis TaxID=1385591 RepID=UPI001CF7C7D3|nr:hypothetical protein [Burkholderia mayonis]